VAELPSPALSLLCKPGHGHFAGGNRKDTVKVCVDADEQKGLVSLSKKVGETPQPEPQEFF
jgi:hypothetical protein